MANDLVSQHLNSRLLCTKKRYLSVSILKRQNSMKKEMTRAEKWSMLFLLCLKNVANSCIYSPKMFKSKNTIGHCWSRGLELKCQYHQCSMSSFYEGRSQKCNKNWHLDCLFMCLRDLHAQKLLVERWWNWAQTSSGLLYFTFIFFFLSTFLILFKILNINVIDKISYQQQKDQEKQRCEREQKIFEIVFDWPPKCLHTD